MEFVGFNLRNNLFVAPMAGVTDRPFRQLCKKLGAGLAVSEMVTSNSLLYGSANWTAGALRPLPMALSVLSRRLSRRSLLPAVWHSALWI